MMQLNIVLLIVLMVLLLILRPVDVLVYVRINLFSMQKMILKLVCRYVLIIHLVIIRLEDVLRRVLVVLCRLMTLIFVYSSVHLVIMPMSQHNFVYHLVCLLIMVILLQEAVSFNVLSINCSSLITQLELVFIPVHKVALLSKEL